MDAWRLLLGALILVATNSPSLRAQSLAPRAYWPAPSGTNLVVVGFAYQEGDVVTDPSLPVEDVEGKMTTLQTALVRFFSLAGRTASVSLEVPRTEVSLDGLLEGEASSKDLVGLLDLNLRLAVNLRGAPAMSPAEFREFLGDPKPILGASLRIQAPTGDYDPNRLINLGTNRWSVKPELGYLRRLRPKWVVELAMGVWFYGDNNNFQGQTREQDPLAAGEVHVVRQVQRLSPSVWASLDLNYFDGGGTRVDQERKNDRQSNSRIGATVVIPLGRHQAIKLAGSTSLATESGGRFTTGVVAYQRVWR